MALRVTAVCLQLRQTVGGLILIRSSLQRSYVGCMKAELCCEVLVFCTEAFYKNPSLHFMFELFLGHIMTFSHHRQQTYEVLF